MSLTPSKEKTLFVACPLGAEDSVERVRSDRLLRYIIEPVVEPLGYKVVRSDKIMDNGNITIQIIEHLIEDGLVIADMTDYNPNVFYELAVRHAARKPAVHVIAKGQRIPFDVTTDRAINYGFEPEDVEDAKARLGAMIEAIQEDDTQPYSPITSAITRMQLSGSAEPDKKIESGILQQLEDIKIRLGALDERLQISRTPSAAGAAAFMLPSEIVSPDPAPSLDTTLRAAWIVTVFLSYYAGEDQFDRVTTAQALDGLYESLATNARRQRLMNKATEERLTLLRTTIDRLASPNKASEDRKFQ